MNTVEYLIKNLNKLGISDFFGLPGDYNFNIVSEIENNTDVRWIGCTNELNAGYAADGYARHKGFGALVTTYGVGELSAINAIAGCYAENVPVIHIVGVPSTEDFKGKKILHHSFQDAEPEVYMKMMNEVSASSAFLNKDNAKLEIDKVLKVFVKTRKPVYIAIPSDIALMEISDKEVDYDWVSDIQTLEKVVKIAADKINAANNPVILADVLINRFDAKDAFIDFTEKSGLPITNFLMGTGIINSNCENYAGTYLSKNGNPNAEKLLSDTDCLISVGVINGDMNSFGANLPYKINSHVAIYGTYTYVDGKKYDNIKMSDVLKELSKIVSKRKCENYVQESASFCKFATKDALNSNYIYSRLQEYIKSDDIIIAECGLIPYGLFNIKFPPNIKIYSQLLWCSIGWATASALGVGIASPQSRIIIITGDGAHQVSAMEIGNIVRLGLKPIIIVVNNHGYGIERLLSNQPNAEFNNIMQMDYSKFVRSFTGDVWATRVNTEDDFDRALRVTQLMDKLCYIDAIIESTDIPEVAKILCKDTSTKIIKAESKLQEKIVLDSSFEYETSVHKSIKDFDEEYENQTSDIENEEVVTDEQTDITNEDTNG